MKKNKLRDSYAILAWIQDEPGAQNVEDLLISAKTGQINLFMSEINLGEIYYKCKPLEPQHSFDTEKSER